MKSETRQQLYRVFSPYKDDLHLARRVGISNPLHLLTEVDFTKMGRELDLTVLLYEVEVLRHFLPRILELNDFPRQKMTHWAWFDLEHKLGRLKWREWPEIEVETLRALWREWAFESLENGKMENFVGGILIPVSEDLTPYLDLWLDARPVEVAEFLQSRDWNDTNDSAVQWAKDSRVGAQLEAAFFQNTDARDDEILSKAVGLLENLRAFDAQKP